MSDYNPSNEGKGTGSAIAAAVLGSLIAVALVAAYTLHAFWWQS